MWRTGNASGETQIVVTDRDGAELKEREALEEAELLYASVDSEVSIAYLLVGNAWPQRAVFACWFAARRQCIEACSYSL